MIRLEYIIKCSMDFLSKLGFGKGEKKKKGRKKNDGKGERFYSLNNVKMHVSSLMGSGPKKQQCQDTCCVLENLDNECYFFAVYDGHGSSGREASQTANDHIQSEFQKSSSKGELKKLLSDDHREDYLRRIFKNAEKKLKSSGIDYSNSGTCAISVYIQKNTAYIANLGDSRAVLYRETAKEKLAIELSYDHKPTRNDERERIEKMGGKIYRLTHDGVQVGPPRVWADEEGPGIAMTRSLGDLEGKKIGLISDPQIQHLQLEETDKFIVIGSDGCWDVMSSAEVCGFVNQYSEDRENVATALVNECKLRWEQNNRNKKNTSKIGDLPYLKYGRDDISVVVAYLQFQEVLEDETSKK